MEIFIAYKTDNWHSDLSKDMIACCTNKQKAIRKVILYAKMENKKIDDDQMYNLEHFDQTQGYGKGEFMIEGIELDKLLK